MRMDAVLDPKIVFIRWPSLPKKSKDGYPSIDGYFFANSGPSPFPISTRKLIYFSLNTAISSNHREILKEKNFTRNRKWAYRTGKLSLWQSDAKAAIYLTIQKKKKSEI
jgi:hypothetical protein